VEEKKMGVKGREISCDVTAQEGESINDTKCRRMNKQTKFIGC
jgi:hypothetical protein